MRSAMFIVYDPAQVNGQSRAITADAKEIMLERGGGDFNIELLNADLKLSYAEAVVLFRMLGGLIRDPVVTAQAKNNRPFLSPEEIQKLGQMQ